MTSRHVLPHSLHVQVEQAIARGQSAARIARDLHVTTQAVAAVRAWMDWCCEDSPRDYSAEQEQAPCGTPSAYRRHLRHEQEPCQACRMAWTDHRREKRHERNRGAA